MRERIMPLLRGPAGALLAALVLGSVAMWIAGSDPYEGFSALLVGALGSPSGIAETLVQTTALLFPALAVTIAFRGGLFNIGAEGQLIIGGLVCGSIGAAFAPPAIVAIPLLLVAGAAGGAGWGAIAGWLRARFEASEVISTIMLNILAGLLAQYLLTSLLRMSGGSGNETAPLPSEAWLPTLLPGSRLTIAIAIAVALALGLRWMLARTVFGFELRAAGESPQVARRAGVALERMTVRVMALSGACAGIGGATIVMGVLHRFNVSLSPGYGFIAIAVALVGNLDPLYVILASVGFGILQAGALSMQSVGHVPKDVITVVEGILVFILAAQRYVLSKAKR